MPVFLLDLSNADFAVGKGPFPVGKGGPIQALAGIARVALLAGVAVALAATVAYVIQDRAKVKLARSVQTVVAQVTGCDGPGRFMNVRFHYTVDGKNYDQNGYMRQSVFVGGAGLYNACKGPTIELRYLAGDPNRWSLPPFNPITREEWEAHVPYVYLVMGPMLLFFGAMFSLVAHTMKKTKENRERFAREGVILAAELIKAKEDTSEDTMYSMIAQYQFRNPKGEVLKGKTAALRHDVKKKDYPVPGTPMLVVYVNDDLFTAL